MPHVRFQVPFLGPESQLKSGFACAGLLCKTALEGAQGPSKTLGLGASARCISSMGIFSLSDEAVKGARRRRGKPRLDQHMRRTLRLPCVPRAGLGKPWNASNANKPASSWLPKQDPKN